MKIRSFLVGALIVFSSSAFAQDIDDDQLIDQETQNDIATLETEFRLKSFSSCEDMDSVLRSHLEQSIRNQFAGGYHGGYYPRGLLIEGDAFETFGAEDSAVGESKATASPVAADGNEAQNFSETNIQVAGVDESDIVKTDGKYIYYYHANDRAVYIARAYPAKDLDIIKKINLPDNYGSIQLYISNKRLVILGTRWDNSYVQPRSIVGVNHSSKTMVAVFDVSDPTTPLLDRYYLVDGNMIRSRRIGDKLYVLSQNHMYVNPWAVFQGQDDWDLDDVLEAFEKDFSTDAILPQGLEFAVTNDESKFISKEDKKYPYQLTSGAITDCSEIEYVLPDEQTQKQFQTYPNFVTISVLDLDKPTQEVTSNVVFGDINEIYMSLENLYITSRQYVSQPFRCPADAFCILPVFESYTNTLVHKLNVDGDTLSYQDSTIIPGAPLTQYAMHENDGYFHIVNQTYQPERSSDVFILDSELKLSGSVRNIAPGEDFKSSRFMGDKLYLVTFEQIDPLFTIDIADPKNPEILGELKIPGFSTYLHPYDENHLIGIGYDTQENEWGGTTTAGVKIDLYDVSDLANPKQKFTKTLGGQGSNSEALYNPRAFVWDAQTKRLYLPATLMERKDDGSYENASAWQGVVAMNIHKNSGITIDGEITHIDLEAINERIDEECEKYESKPDEPVCRILRNGDEYCYTPEPAGGDVPEYCFADSDEKAYLAKYIWNFYDSYINRVLYLDDTLYTLSNNKIQTNEIGGSYTTTKSLHWSPEKMIDLEKVEGEELEPVAEE